ncbi:hypothetical protein SLE2022_375320 [Rubroshorea leprosula]
MLTPTYRRATPFKQSRPIPNLLHSYPWLGFAFAVYSIPRAETLPQFRVRCSDSVLYTVWKSKLIELILRVNGGTEDCEKES